MLRCVIFSISGDSNRRRLQFKLPLNAVYGYLFGHSASSIFTLMFNAARNENTIVYVTVTKESVVKFRNETLTRMIEKFETTLIWYFKIIFPIWISFFWMTSEKFKLSQSTSLLSISSSICLSFLYAERERESFHKLSLTELDLA